MEQQNKEYCDEIYIYDLWKVIVKRRIVIIGLFLTIVISTAIVSLFMPKIYRGEVKLSVIDNNTLPTSDINGRNILIIKSAEDAKEIIDIMGSIDDEKKKIVLPQTYASVTSISLKPLGDAKNKIVATIDAKSTESILVAISGLVDFLNNMENVKANLKAEKEVLVQRFVELSNIQKTGQDLLVAYNKLIREGKITAIGFNPLELSKNLVDIKNEKLLVEQALSRLKNGRIQIITLPDIFTKPVSPKISQNVFVAGILSLFFGIALAFLIEYIEKIKNTRSVNSNS
jgi:uncharacterized protein involved in exopolysaccharide biosynthesis